MQLLCRAKHGQIVQSLSSSKAATAINVLVPELKEPSEIQSEVFYELVPDMCFTKTEYCFSASGLTLVVTVHLRVPNRQTFGGLAGLIVLIGLEKRELLALVREGRMCCLSTR